MSFGNLFFLDDKWRNLLEQVRMTEQNSVDKQVLDLAFERHLRKTQGQDVDVSELQKAFIPEYISEVKKAFPNATPQELSRLTDTHIEEIDNLAASFVKRSFSIMDLFLETIETSMMEKAERAIGSKLDKAIDEKIEVKLAAYPIDKEKQIRDKLGDANLVIHESDLIRYLSKKAEKDKENEVRNLYGLN